MANSQKITAELKEHIGKNHDHLYLEIYQDFEAYEDATIIPNVKNSIRLTSLAIGNILKPYTNVFSPTADAIEFKPRTMHIRVGKAEVKVDPEEYRTTYLSNFAKNGVGKTPEDLPFAKFIMDSIIEKIKEELNDETAYFGEYDPLGLTAIDVADGWGTNLAKMITDGEVVPEILGVLNATNAYTKIRQLYRSIPAKYRKKKANLVAYISQNTFDAIEDQLDSLNANTGKGEEHLGAKYLRGTSKKLEIRVASWMGESERIIITPKGNLCILTDLTEDNLNEINVLLQHYTADLTITFAIGFDFATNMLWCNEAA